MTTAAGATTAGVYAPVVAVTAVLLVAVVAARVAASAGLPTLLLSLAIGIAVGESGLGVRFEDFALTQDLGLLALAVILAEGGLTTRWATVRTALPFAVVLSTVGVAVAVAVVAAGAHLLLGFEIRSAVLLGAILASTDAAAVFSVLRNLPIRTRTRAALEAEAGLNDAPVVILVLLVVGPDWGQTSPWLLVPEVAYELGLGAGVGLLAGRLGQELLSRVALPATGLYPLATLTLTLFAFGAAGAIGGSGFLAVYVAGLVLGNAALPHRRASLAFAEGVAWLAQIGLFVLLGLLASPAELPAQVWPALVLGSVVLLLARPLSVLVSAAPFRMPKEEQAFLALSGLRGAVPIVLTTIAATEGLAESREVFAIVFVLVVVFTAVQAPTLPPLARALRLTDRDAAREIDVESAPLAEIGAELIQLTVPEQSRLAGVSVSELRLPTGANVSLVVRSGQTLVPDQGTTLARGDRILVVATRGVRHRTEARLRAVSRAGRLARWHGETGTEGTVLHEDERGWTFPSWPLRSRWPRLRERR